MDFDEKISISSLNKMLNCRIEKLIANTPSEENTRRQILYQIQDLPTFSRRLSGFLDYTIDHSSFLHQEIWNLQSQIYAEKEKNAISKNSRLKTKQKPVNVEENQKLEERINRLSTRLGVKPNKINEEIENLLKIEEKQKKRSQGVMSEKEAEYKRCLKLMSSDKGDLSFVVGDLIQKIRRTKNIHNTTQERFSSYSPTTPKAFVRKTTTESPPQLQSISDL